jgi:hypothetical protein
MLPKALKAPRLVTHTRRFRGGVLSSIARFSHPRPCGQVSSHPKSFKPQGAEEATKKSVDPAAADPILIISIISITGLAQRPFVKRDRTRSPALGPSSPSVWVLRER